MNFDFELLLTSLTIISGIIWLIDILLQRFIFNKSNGSTGTKTKPADSSAKTKNSPLLKSYNALVEFGKFLFPVVFVVLFLRSFIAEPFKIPSRSMLPTLTVSDFILVNKMSYGIRLPVLHTKIFAVGQPERGEIFVFRYPKDPSLNYIKRVIGLPGDTIEYYNKVLHINGEVVPQSYQDSYRIDDTGSAQRLTEMLGNDEHDMLHMQPFPSRDGKWKVPPGHYFAMGDNRDNSNDSRVWGFVPEENLVGRAFFIFFHWGEWARMGIID